MRDWSWIDNIPKSWTFLLRVIVKALLLFGLCNLIFAWIYPMEWIGQFSLYGTVYPARPRLPYGENPSESYNVSINNIPALFASHEVSQAYPDDEFRVFLIGDSSTWGWLLENDETLSAQLNSAGLSMNDESVVSYNLGYPVMSLTKDLLILDEAMQYNPDIIIWLVSLASFPPEQQLFPPLVQENREHLLPLIASYNLTINPDNEAFIQAGFWERTIIGQRRPLADLLRLQTYGLSWSATGIDQATPRMITLRQSDFEEDFSWSTHSDPTELTRDDLAFDVLSAGIQRAGDIPVIIVNEPMFISDGQNSDVRYNNFYPRWAYDQYRALLAEISTANSWQYFDLWDRIDSQEFTDSPVHLTADGTETLANNLIDMIFNTED